MSTTGYRQTYGSSGYGMGLYGDAPLVELPLTYYLNKFTPEYANSTKTRALATLFLKKLDDVTHFLTWLMVNVDIDLAVGPVLDMLGGVVGAARTVNFQPSGSVSPVLDDSTYRILIKAKIAFNQWDGGIDSLYTIWQSLFPSGVIMIADQQNMSAWILMQGTFTTIVQDLIKNDYIVPRPEGVRYHYAFVTFPVLGFDFDNSYVAGFDKGHFIDEA